MFHACSVVAAGSYPAWQNRKELVREELRPCGLWDEGNQHFVDCDREQINLALLQLWNPGWSKLGWEILKMIGELCHFFLERSLLTKYIYHDTWELCIQGMVKMIGQSTLNMNDTSTKWASQVNVACICCSVATASFTGGLAEERSWFESH